MSIAYQYDLNYFYVGKTSYSKDNVPNRAVTIAPTIIDGYIPQWDGEVWGQVENHVGTKGYIGKNPVEINTYGPLPDGFSLEPVYTPAEQQVQLLAQFTAYIQTYLDDFAKTRLYDNIGSACTYATSKNAIFAAEGQYCVEARDAVWLAGYAIQNEVLSGARAMPTKDELLALLPVLEWPTERPAGM